MCFRSNIRKKLFVIMRVGLVAWILPIGYRVAHGYNWSDTYQGILAVCLGLEVLQRFFTFLIFVWKDDVKESFGKQFHIMMRKLGSYFRRDATAHACENGNEDFMTRL